MPCVFVTEVKEEPSAKRDHQPFKVSATETISHKALDADIYSAIPTEKVDGTCCYVTTYKDQPYLWARLDRKPNKQEDFKPAAECWIPAKEIEQMNGNPEPDENGHIPGWVPVEKNNKRYCWHSSVVNYEFEIALVHRHHLGLCWPIPDTYMNSRPVIINMNLNKCDSAFNIKCLFNHFSKIDNQKFARLKDIIFDV
uniref:RNA ligase 1 n=1 Tax=Cebus imitator TaxID=2715852 RepID=A0A2K5Q4Y7_CEBIM